LFDKIPCDANGTPTITSIDQVGLFVANIVRIIIAISGSLAVITLLVAALYYITATGDSGRIGTAKNIIQNTVIGLVVILISYAVVTFIAGEF
jgi:hypothetical protein